LLVAAINRIGAEYTIMGWRPAVSGKFPRFRRLLINCIFDARNSGRQSDGFCYSNTFFVLQTINELSYYLLFYTKGIDAEG
jgi:hypothetical protein